MIIVQLRPQSISYRQTLTPWVRQLSPSQRCYGDKITQQILRKVENVTGVPEINYEFFQILRCEEGGLDRAHSDYIPADQGRNQGVREVTFFIYLNDGDPETGL
jgi:hypothetical protein